MFSDVGTSGVSGPLESPAPQAEVEPGLELLSRVYLSMGSGGGRDF